jgi:hypothetical protein
MKHEYPVFKSSPVTDLPESGDQTHLKETKLDQAIEEIHSRANHMGSVMEELMRPHDAKKDNSTQQK